MDSLTHIASGALIGEAFFGKKLGKRAMLIGAAAQSLPDIDFVASFWLSPTDELLAHRGITHSFLFGVMISFVLGIIALRTHRGYSIPLKNWIFFFGIEIGTHLFLDAFNNYGIGWFEPFGSQRISFNTIYVFDPLYSIWLIIAFIALLAVSRFNTRRWQWVLFGLTVSTLYLFLALVHKRSIDNAVRENIASQQLSGLYFSTPTAFNNLLWYVVVKDSSDFLVGYRSVFDHQNEITFRRFPQQVNLLTPFQDLRDVQQLTRFSQGFFTVRNQNDTLVFNDLRFGQIVGWSQPYAPFVFHYYLNHPEANALVVQRGRFEGWNMKSIEELLTRIKGN